MSYKRSFFQVSQPLRPGIVLCSCFRTNAHILLSDDVYNLYSGNQDSLHTLEEHYPKAFERLVEGQFLVNAECDELGEWEESRRRSVEDTELYHVIVNPTLDCNLSCWYCYESKVTGSEMDAATMDGVCRHIALHYDEQPFSLLKLSFFGGEPFLRPRVVRRLVGFAKDFCTERGIGLLLDFTTNGTLLTEGVIDIIKDLTCQFQITLDGNRERHNKIKFIANKGTDTFSLTLGNIRRIQERIPDSFVAVRINFDGQTLAEFDSILGELIQLDRKRTMVIMKKIWQVDGDDVQWEQVESCLNMLYDNNFIVDYYSQGGTCFADRRNQVTFNYDGGVFKCTTINNFDETTSLGRLDAVTGEISWDKERTGYLDNDAVPAMCLGCRVLPFCGGHCRKHVSEGHDKACFLTGIGMSVEAYARQQFMINLIKDQKKWKQGAGADS